MWSLSINIVEEIKMKCGVQSVALPLAYTSTHIEAGMKPESGCGLDITMTASDSNPPPAIDYIGLPATQSPGLSDTCREMLAPAEDEVAAEAIADLPPSEAFSQFLSTIERRNWQGQIFYRPEDVHSWLLHREAAEAPPPREPARRGFPSRSVRADHSQRCCSGLFARFLRPASSRGESWVLGLSLPARQHQRCQTRSRRWHRLRHGPGLSQTG